MAIHARDANPDAAAPSRLGPVVSVPAWATRMTLSRVLVAVPVVVVATTAVGRRWTYDDAYVYFRTVDQILAGHGPVWNAGDRVEAFASPLWLVALTVGDLLSPFRIEYTAAGLSLACTIGALLLAIAAARTLQHRSPDARRSIVWVPLGLAVIAALWPTWIWSTGGMETGLVLLWLAASARITSRWAVAPQTCPPIGRAALILLGSGWIVGWHDAAASVIVVTVVAFGAPYPGRRRWAVFGWAFVLPAGFQFLRMGYYGMVLPAASVVREDSQPRPGFGWDYLVDFLSPYLLAVPLVAIALAAYVPLVRDLISGSSRRALVVVAWPFIGITHAALVVVVAGGDSVHGRQLLPGLFAALVPVFVVAAERRFVPAVAVTWPWAVLCAALLRPDGDPAAAFPTAYPGPRLTYADAGYDARGAQAWMDGPGFYLADPFAPDGVRLDLELADPDRTVVASPGADVLAYVLGPEIEVLDISGTGDPLIGHHEVEFRVAPGAEKAAYGPWIAARYAADPTAILTDDIPFERPYHDPLPTLDLLEQIAWAEAALDCRPLERRIDAATEPLGPGRVVENVWDAMSNTSMRMSAVPERAYESACGRDIPSPVVEFWREIDADGVVPVNAARGRLAVAGRCDITLVSAGDPGEPWRVTDARTRRAAIELDPTADEVLFAAVFEIGPPRGDAAVVWIATDGSGNVQVVLDVPWYPSVASPWTPIDAGSPVDVAVVPNLESQSWSTTVDGQAVGQLPMLAGAPPDGDLVAWIPRTAAPGSEHPTILHERYEVPDACQGIAAQHAVAGGGARGQVRRVAPAIS